jgi:hypothetical protein
VAAAFLYGFPPSSFPAPKFEFDRDSKRVMA